MSADKEPKKNRSFLVMYAIALFSVAAIIILLSYLYSSRMNQSAEELEKSQQLSISALQSVDKLIEDNRMLNEQIAAMEEKLELTETELSETHQALKGKEKEQDNTNKELASIKAKLDEMTNLYNELLLQGEETDD